MIRTKNWRHETHPDYEVPETERIDCASGLAGDYAKLHYDPSYNEDKIFLMVFEDDSQCAIQMGLDEARELRALLDHQIRYMQDLP